MKSIFTFIFTFSCLFGYAQKEANFWYFGQWAAIDFNTGIPNAVSGSAMITTEGSASISDTAGNLLFYTNGVDVWDRNNMQMSNGFGLMGGISTTQSALIVPHPDSSNLYYIFTVAETGGNDGFRYSVVDMNLNNGKGDVTVKNVFVFTPVTEKLTAVKNFNTGSYWILVHEWGTNAFMAYQFSSAGFNMTPVISNTGVIHNTSVIQNTYGQMKFSPCGNRVAAAVGYQDIVEVYDFDIATGLVYNPLTINPGDHVYGVEFSPDNNKLYVSTYDPSGTLLQYNLAAGSPTAVIASQTVLSQTPDIYPLQLAPDGKIYVTKSWSPMLGVINDPDVAGTGSNYNDNGLDLDPNFIGASAALSLPSFVQSYFTLEGECSATGLAEITDKSFVVSPNPSTGGFEIKGNFHYPLRIKLNNLLGQTIEEMLTTNKFLKFNVLPGIYFISIFEGDKIITEKVIIK